ncbi:MULTISPECIES: hypothetical protein [Vibrio]|uniref:hypothetical protein n=1 Tax=Vibrio TaxID=662 RepID=UPI0008258684|nr:hypothetical protein [Vibrio parahaemolyticus]EHH2504883.1 hypothetical protein [Vibrio parahaemolyticus]EIU6752579.1 hypothetical protein [Vibrio parahaemolyticus]EIZ1329424.1 hypothetical protein [Vibrio parahaemolyticus]EJB5624721.1 hypothetical protein [Vibrio parahaemolyticus]EJG0413918.1 hypothetical protein [Vibrio parahaemolyticus]
MSSVDAIKVILQKLMIEVSTLSDSDLMKIADGTHDLSIKITRKKLSNNENNSISSERLDNLINELKNCESRESGINLLTENFKNKKELEYFAKKLDIMILKQDRIDVIKDKIIEATIGALLRSNAIQGKKI